MLICFAQDYNDEITQGQVQELAYLNGGVAPARGRGRGVDPSSAYPRMSGGSVSGSVGAMAWGAPQKFVRIPDTARFATSIR